MRTEHLKSTRKQFTPNMEIRYHPDSIWHKANPMITSTELRKRREEIIAIATRYGASDIRIFGSVARGDATENSDLDLIVRFEPGRSLFDQGGLLMDLRELLGMKVDVISEGALSGRFGQIANEEAVPL